LLHPDNGVYDAGKFLQPTFSSFLPMSSPQQELRPLRPQDLGLFVSGGIKEVEGVSTVHDLANPLADKQMV